MLSLRRMRFTLTGAVKQFEEVRYKSDQPKNLRLLATGLVLTTRTDWF